MPAPHAILGMDLTRIHGLGPSLALTLVGACGTDLSVWPSAKHVTSWLCLAPNSTIAGGKALSARARRSGRRAAALLRLAATTVGKTETAPGAFGRPASARAVTATARAGKGNWRDNAPVESVFGRLKADLVHQQRYPTREAAKRDLFADIEGHYNRQRLHSALGYIAPEQAELRTA